MKRHEIIELVQTNIDTIFDKIQIEGGRYIFPRENLIIEHEDDPFESLINARNLVGREIHALSFLITLITKVSPHMAVTTLVPSAYDISQPLKLRVVLRVTYDTYIPTLTLTLSEGDLATVPATVSDFISILTNYKSAFQLELDQIISKITSLNEDLELDSFAFPEYSDVIDPDLNEHTIKEKEKEKNK